MYRDTLARVFSCATVTHHWRTGIFIPTGNTTHILKKEIRCCAYYTYGSCLFPNGEGESGAFLLKKYSLYAPDSPSPSACRLTSLKWSTMVCRPDHRQDPTDMKHALPPFNPSGHVSWAIEKGCHTKIPHGQFDGEPASTYCRTEGHHLPQDGIQVPQQTPASHQPAFVY